MADKEPRRPYKKPPSPLTISAASDQGFAEQFRRLDVNSHPAPTSQHRSSPSPSPRPQWVPDWTPSTGVSPRALRLHELSPLPTGDVQSFVFCAEPPRGSPIPPSHSGVFSRTSSPIQSPLSVTRTGDRQMTSPVPVASVLTSSLPVPTNPANTVASPKTKQPTELREPQEWPKSTIPIVRTQWCPDYGQTRGLSSQARRKEQFASMKTEATEVPVRAASTGQNAKEKASADRSESAQEAESNTMDTSSSLRFFPRVVGRTPVTYQIPVFAVPADISHQGFPIVSGYHDEAYCKFGSPQMRCFSSYVEAEMTTTKTLPAAHFSTLMGRRVGRAPQIVRPSVVGYVPVTYFAPLIGYIREDAMIASYQEADCHIGHMVLDDGKECENIVPDATGEAVIGKVLNIKFPKVVCTTENDSSARKLVMPYIGGHSEITFDQDGSPGMRQVIMPLEDHPKPPSNETFRRLFWTIEKGVHAYLERLSAREYTTKSQVDAAKRFWGVRVTWLPDARRFEALRVFYHQLSRLEDSVFVLKAADLELKYGIKPHLCGVHDQEILFFRSVFYCDPSKFA